LRYYYDFFDRYDMISYPILYATAVGDETGPVSVFRIGPEDAELLVPNKTDRRKKLAGTYLSNFGALLEERFRENDILWGRLDAAERIITAVLRTSSVDATNNQQIDNMRRRLVAEAQTAILLEHRDLVSNIIGKEIPAPKEWNDLEVDLRA